MDVQSPDGTRIAIHAQGGGPPVLFVHGTAADHGDWAGVAACLPDVTCLLMDRRGRGASGDGRNHSLAAEAADVAATAKATKARLVVAHSYGALATLEACRLGLPAVVLYEPPFFDDADPDAAIPLEGLLREGRREAMLERFLGEIAGATPEEVAMAKADASWAAAVASAPTVPREVRASFAYRFDAAGLPPTPATVLLGSLSPPFFHDAGQRAAKALRGHVHILEGQGHAALQTGPDLVAHQVRLALRTNSVS